MADNRATTIINAVVTTLTDLATTGEHVYLGRVYTLDEDELPALRIYRGENKPLDVGDQNISYLDMILEIWVEAAVRANEYLEETLAQIEREVIVALKSDTTQGLAYVMDTQEGGAEEPQLAADANIPAAIMRLQFFIKYRRSRTDPGA